MRKVSCKWGEGAKCAGQNDRQPKTSFRISILIFRSCPLAWLFAQSLSGRFPSSERDMQRIRQIICFEGCFACWRLQQLVRDLLIGWVGADTFTLIQNAYSKAALHEVFGIIRFQINRKDSYVVNH